MTYDLISRQAAISTVKNMRQRCEDDLNEFYELLLVCFEDLPSTQPDPLSDAYMKAVWTWLLNYQVKAAELQGKYTPYEVMSWVVNDWRKEHG